jgi:hypothetical protein
MAAHHFGFFYMSFLRDHNFKLDYPAQRD